MKCNDYVKLLLIDLMKYISLSTIFANFLNNHWTSCHWHVFWTIF